MKCLLFILLLPMSGYLRAQPLHIRNITYDLPNVELSPKLLSRYLTAGETSELRKVKAIFYWITENISYRVKGNSPLKPFALDNSEADTFDYDVFMRTPNEEIIAEKVLLRRSAYCDGYSKLFKTLCDYAGIRSEIITGFARCSTGKAHFGSNHSWNAVRIDSTWYLLDATWASGYLTYSGEFVKNYDDRYFLPDPRNFILDHYPEDLRWTLLSKQPVENEYRNAPFRFSAFLGHNIISFVPATGVIEAAIGDTLYFQIRGDKAKRLFISAEPYSDTSFLQAGPGQDETSDKQSAKYIVECADVEWLYIVYNNETILRYKLHIKK